MMKSIVYYGPPGTGKTRTLVSHLAAYQNEGTKKPITFLSFTKAAAVEATSRVSMPNLRISTLHSLAFNYLGLSSKSVIDNAKLAEFSEATGIPFKALLKGARDIQEGDEFLSVLSFANNRFMDVIEAYDHFGRPGTLDRFEMFIKAYANWKRGTGFIDYDDMLMKFRDRLDINHGKQTGTPWPIVFLDEAQDLTPLQWRLFNQVVERSEDVYVAGDDDQAIFEWNGANPHGMAEFAEAQGSAVQVLDQSWRVPADVHAMANYRILQQIRSRHNKKFRPADRSGQIIRYGDIESMDLVAACAEGAMILVRDRFRMEEVQRHLNQDMIPYDAIGGMSPFNSKFARAIRCWHKIEAKEEFTVAESAAFGATLRSDAERQAWAHGRTVKWRPWQQMLAIPPHLAHFYQAADMRAPLDVTVSTIHQAKGKEHHNVIVDLTLSPRVEAGVDLDPDAERRVMYVAITRTSEKLTLCAENSILS